MRVVLLQSDLRLNDNPALSAAAAFDDPIVIVFVPFQRKGSARDAYFYESALLLQAKLKAQGVLNIFASFEELDAFFSYLQHHFSLRAIYFNKLDRSLPDKWHDLAVKTEENLLFPKLEKAFKVFTPFWKHCLALQASFSVLPVPVFHRYHQGPELDWAEGLSKNMAPWWLKVKQHCMIGEDAALKRWVAFKTHFFSDYDEKRDFMDAPCTSELSAALAVGEISVRYLWQEVIERCGVRHPQLATSKFLNEIGWREFAAHLLSHYPEMSEQALNPKYQDFPWRENAAWFERWKAGETGYPIIDAAMKQLWETGIMHNRSRMLVASFLTKNLLIPWQAGEKWFFDTLIDADVASNAMNWQWVAGCGTDAAPYFRIFNPMLQAEKFDPRGVYRKKWLPALAHLDAQALQEPWSRVSTYPLPLVDLNLSRKKALDLFQAWNNQAPQSLFDA